MAGNVVSNVKKYYGGQVPVPGQGDSDGKVKVLVEKTTTMEIEGVQTDVDLLYDADDLTVPVTPQKLGQWTDENYLIVFKAKDADGKVRGFILYELETTSTSTDTLVNNAVFVALKGLEIDPGASAFVFTMVEDSSTLTRYLQDENGELTVKFNLSCVEPGAQSGHLSDLIGTDSSYMYFEIVRDDEDHAYLNLNADGLDDELEGMKERLDVIEGILDELPSDEHGYFNSSLVTTPGDGTTTSLVIDNFRISEGRSVHGDNIEFVQTHQEGGVDFGEVYLNPGTYILNVHYTLQWVGSPRGTFLPLVANVGEQPFDFSYGHEDILRSTRIVTRTTRGKFGLNFPFDADTPQMGIWVKYLEIAQIASYNHPAVTHDSTLAGSGQIGDPLGVTPAAFGKVKDIPTSISQFRNGDVIPVDGPNGPAKMAKDDLLTETAQNALAGNVAPAFVPNSTTTVTGQPYMYNGSLYKAKEEYQGPWDASKFESADVGEFSVSRDSSMLIPGVTILASKDYDLNWQNGVITRTDGVISSSPYFKYNVTLIPVNPKTEYLLGHRESAERIYYYDTDGNFISASNEPGASVSSFTFTTPENCRYIRYSYLISSSDGSVLKWNDGFDSSYIENRLAMKVSFDSSMLVTGDVIASKDSAYDWTNGVCTNVNGTIGSSPYFKYNATLIPVSPYAKYRLGHREAAERVYFYDISGNFISASEEPGATSTSFDFVTPDSCHYIRYSYLISSFDGDVLRWKDGFSSSRVEEVAKKFEGPEDYGIINPVKIYDRTRGNGQDVETRVYAEGLVYEKLLPVRINGGVFASITDDNVSAGDTTKTVVLGGGGAAKKSISIPVKYLSVSAIAGKKFVLFIGESTTAAQEKDPWKKAYYEDWGTPSAVQSFNIKDQADGIGRPVMTLGRKCNRNLSITYGGNSYTNRSYNEGFDGWPSYCFANWPCESKLSNSTTRFAGKSMWYALGLATKTPYSASAYNVDTEDYTGSVTQRDLITKTKFGKYKIDGDESLWNIIKYLGTHGGEYPSFTDSSAYTGSVAQISAMQDWCDALAADPINPFFDLNYARDNAKDTAFSIDTYLARYRTMDDLGVRLTGAAGESVTGSDGETYTIGTKVTNTSDYDVCTPNVVIFNVGINDTESAASASSIVGSLKALLNATSIECGWYITRYPGTFIPSLWRDCNSYNRVTPKIFGDYVNALTEWISSQPGKTALPAMLVQPPNSVRGNYVSRCFDSSDVVLDASSNNLHPGLNAYRAIGWNILNWIYSL